MSSFIQTITLFSLRVFAVLDVLSKVGGFNLNVLYWKVLSSAAASMIQVLTV